MFIPKKYGYSKVDRCPFCQKQAFSKNRENVPVCSDHKNQMLGNVKCACGESLQMLEGKFGVIFNCLKCGNMNLRKVLEINDVQAKGSITRESMTKNSTKNNEYNHYSSSNFSSKTSIKDDLSENGFSNDNDSDEQPKENKKNPSKKEITVKSDDPRYFD